MSGTTKQLLSKNHLGVPLKPSEAPVRTKQIGHKAGDVQVAKAKPKKCIRKPPSRKQKPVVIPVGEIGELITRGQQLLDELDRAHYRLHRASEEALSPNPQAWRKVKAAMTSYTANYAELIQLSKRLNRLIAEEHPEQVQSTTPPKPSIFEGDL